MADHENLDEHDFQLDPVQCLRGEYKAAYSALRQEVFAAINKLATEAKTKHNDNFLSQLASQASDSKKHHDKLSAQVATLEAKVASLDRIRQALTETNKDLRRRLATWKEKTGSSRQLSKS
ncbi:hypothetical protein BDD12DRAFT_809071 [Trichophaea hybrida]|nr:hypothetical protein BDD12DRAFT_809071 [Trichophaea hybrida]